MRAPDLEPEKTGSLEPFQFEWNAAIDQRQYLSDSNDQQAGSLLEHSSGFPAEHFPPAQGFGGIYQNFDIGELIPGSIIISTNMNETDKQKIYSMNHILCSTTLRHYRMQMRPLSLVERTSLKV